LVPSLIFFEAEHKYRNIEPDRIDLERNNSFKLKWFTVNSLKFLSESPPGSGQFESTIKSGRINLIENDEVIKITEDEFVRVEVSESHRLVVKQGSGSIQVIFEGLVTKLTKGTQKIEINCMPTYLEYIYHNQRFALFWSCVVFLWTLLWGIKNTLVKQ
jgi:hypothetical protein